MPVVLENGVPRQARSRGLLLEAISTFDTTLVSTLGGASPNALRWLAGVQFQPQPCRSPRILSLDPCVAQTWDDAGTDCQAYITQMPFQINDVLKGSTLTMTDTEMEQMLNERAELMRSWAFAKALVGPVVTPNTMTLASTAHSPTGAAFGSAALPLLQAVAYLENDLAATMFGAEGMLHMSPGHALRLQAGGGLTEGANGVLRTVNGTKVVSDTGYVAMQKPQPTSGPTPSDPAVDGSDNWIYASGPVQYQFYDNGLIGTMGSEYTDIGVNKIRRFRDAMGILVFDPCPVSAVLASYAS